MDRRGPVKGLLAPADETAFQTFMAFNPQVRDWKTAFGNKYGEQPNLTDDPTYDYRKAYMAGNRPVPVASDNIPHWGSEGKADTHPTEWMQLFMQKFGVDPTTLGSFTPEMQQFIQQQIQQTQPTGGLLGGP